MRIMTILGTRPEIIRLSEVIRLLDSHCEHVLVHTGQNFDDRLSRIFFEELSVRVPDEYLGVRSARFGGQVGQVIERSEELMLKYRPDRLLVLGDTNSGLAAMPARRLGIPVLHMEAGNRCYDDRVPEEVNRRVIDHCSTLLLPYTYRSRENLLAEGLSGERIFVTGNPIKQVINRMEEQVTASHVLDELNVSPGRYFLVTLHRAENVDVPARLRQLVDAFCRLREKYEMPVIISLHPRTRARLESQGFEWDQTSLCFSPPFGFADFVRLEKSAFCVLSDSGTVQEETCILGVPSVTIRDVTERPETLECGSGTLSGTAPEAILRSVHLVSGRTFTWKPPSEYLQPHVAEIVANIALSYRQPDAAEVAWKHACASSEEAAHRRCKGSEVPA